MANDDAYSPVPAPEVAAKLAKLTHQVQSAVAFLQQHAASSGKRFPECEPKHLRVGVNSALIEASALARLLLAKRLITSAEYFGSLVVTWEQERDAYLATLKAIDPRFSLGD
jgi:hypothetical protein